MSAKDEWLSFDCKVQGKGEIYVPEFKGTWLISESGMCANIGGNDWAIYTLHPEDCKRICDAHGE